MYRLLPLVGWVGEGEVFFAALLWRGFNGKRAAALGLMITVCIECWQLLVGRATDVDDIILNTLGVFSAIPFPLYGLSTFFDNAAVNFVFDFLLYGIFFEI